MKKLGVGLLVLLLLSVLVFTGCGNKQQEKGTPTTSVDQTEKRSVFEGDESEVYYMVTMVSGVEYWVGVYEGFKLAAAQLGVDTVYTGTPEYDISKEIAVYDSVMSKNPAGIAVHPIEPSSFINPINRSIEAGVPVVTFAADSPESKRIAYITSDNVNEGYTAADAIAEAIGGKGKVAVTENPGQLNHEVRVKSFIERIETNWPDIKVVGSVATNQDTNVAFTGIKSIAQAHPDLGGVFTPEASSGLGAAQAALELGGKIKVMCVDINEPVLDMIHAGEMFGAIQPDVVMQGYLSMMLLYMAKHGLLDPMNGWDELDQLPIDIPVIDNGLDVVNQQNAQYFYTLDYLKSRGTKGTEERTKDMKRSFIQHSGM